jgi:hypothetical protein
VGRTGDAARVGPASRVIRLPLGARARPPGCPGTPLRSEQGSDVLAPDHCTTGVACSAPVELLTAPFLDRGLGDEHPAAAVSTPLLVGERPSAEDCVCALLDGDEPFDAAWKLVVGSARPPTSLLCCA